jgi:hypothetical protein
MRATGFRALCPCSFGPALRRPAMFGGGASGVPPLPFL